jgi:cytoskeleton protein RodZ
MQSSGRRLFKPNAKSPDDKGHLYDVDENGEIVVSVGTELHQARLTAGFELQEVSNSLRIRRAYLEALEEERYGDLPGAPYAVGFVRSYAKFLGLGSDAVVERFKGEVGNIGPRPKLDFPAPANEGRVPKTWLIVVALVLAGVAYGGWQYFSTRDDSEAQRSADVPEDLASLATEIPDDSAPDIVPAHADESPSDDSLEPKAVPEPDAEPTVEAAEAAMSGESSSFGVSVEELPPPDVPVAVAPVADTGITVQPAEPESNVSVGDNLWTPSTPDVREAAASVGPDLSSAGPEAPIHEPRVYGGENLGSRIVIRATGDSWVQIQGPENELLLTRILHEGESYRVPDQPGILLMTGNAGALEVWLDDERLAPLGPLGLVLRDLALEPDALRATAVEEQPGGL